MKNKTALFASFFCCAALLAAEPQVKINKPWKAMENGFELIGTIRNSPRISTEWPLEPQRHYKLSFELESAGAVKLGCTMILGSRKAVHNLRPQQGNARYEIPFFSGDETSIKIDFFNSPESAPVNLKLRNLKLDVLTDADFRKELIPSGDFEEGFSPAAFFFKGDPRIVPCDTFLSGEKALEFTGGKGKELRSRPLPVRIGKTYRLKFSAASAKGKAGAAAGIQFWSPFGHKGKHFYRQTRLALIETPQDFSIEITVPPASEAPDAADGVVLLNFYSGEENAVIRIDALSFREGETK